MVAKQVHVEANRDFELSYDRLLHRTFEPGPLARVLARALPGVLDKALIAGSDPAGSRALAARAATLTEPRSRAAIADGLERLLELAHGSRSGATVLRRGAHLVGNASALRELSAVLRSSAPLYARGIAMAQQLLTDGTGPAYVGDGGALASRLLEARTAMYGLEMQGGLVKHLGPSYRLPGGSWIYRRHDSS